MSRVCVFFAEGFEEVEALTPVDLLRRAGISVSMVSIGETLTVTGRSGITVVADSLLSETTFDDTEMLVLPGGMPGTKYLGECETLTARVRAFAENPEKKIAAICAAPTVFGQLGLLNGRKACCYPGLEGKLAGAEVSYEDVVTDGNITTSRGAGTAKAFALRLIAELTDEETAEKVRAGIMG